MPGASNPGTMREDIGGGAFNALRSAARRGADGALFSVRGGDAAGDAVHEAIIRSGITDLSAVFLDRTTASYTALLDRDGEVIAALADMALYDIAFPKQVGRSKLREAVAAADAVLCDANLPAPALARLMQLAKDRPLFAIAVSPVKAARLAGLLAGLSCLFMNRREARVLSGGMAGDIATTVARLRAEGLARGVITGGAEPLVAFDAAGMIELTPPAPHRIVDVTGAGDALAGAAAVAMLRGLPLSAALREGAAAAMLAVEARSSVPDLSPSDFAMALARVPEACLKQEGGSE
jgi:sugar/nucleoside kinase (ribokinase family)